MLRNLIVLPDGTEIFSGNGAAHTIQSCTITSSSNSGMELTPGSVCSTALEAKLFTPGGNLTLPVETDVTLYKVSEDGTRTKVGVFTLEAPERPTRNTYRINAYDHVAKLERDITPMLNELEGWPYPMLTLAQMVCEDCLMTLVNDSIPNGDFLVNKFPANKMTARELLGYIGQLAGRFCRATPDGDIEFAWYTDSNLVIEPTGDRYFNSLKYEDYRVERIDKVQVQLANSEYGLPFPDAQETDNCYVITGNPLITAVNNDILPYLEVLRQEIGECVYTPCKVTLPASLDIQPGHIVRIVYDEDHILTTYVMTKTQRGQKETLESVGSARRDSPSAVNMKTFRDQVDAAIKRQTQSEIFNKLTNYGSSQGLYIDENGNIFINASFISSGTLQSPDGTTFYLDLENGILNMDATSLKIGGKNLSEAALGEMTQEEIVAALTENGMSKGIYLEDGQLYINATYLKSGTLNADLIKAGVLQSKDGETFKLDLNKGTFSMVGTGKFMAPDGKSYMTMDGNEFIMYTKDTNDDWMALAKIGFSEDSEGVDYPYILMGHAVDDEQAQNLSLVKGFSNGIYVGNAVPRLSTGRFVGLTGAVGFFVDVEKQETYNVVGTELYDAFTAVFG